jgi:RES domain-containing protein
VVYTSESQALAALEYLVHLDLQELPPDLTIRPGTIPDGLAVERIDPRSLPADWRRYPAPEALAEIGTEWARAGRTAVLAVPSVVIPDEWNYLVNPAHPEFGRIHIGPVRPFTLDPLLRLRVTPGL